MSFISAIQLSKNYNTRNGRPRVAVDEDVYMATDKSVQKTGQIVYSLRFSISEKLIKEARFIEGDKVDVLFDFESNPKRVLIVRSLTGGWTLYRNGKNANSRYNFKIVHRPEMPSFTESTPTKAVVTSEGILFDVPTTAIFGRNARA